MDTDTLKIVIEDKYNGQRLDRVCVDLFPEFSRERIKQLIAANGITIRDAKNLKPSIKVETGQVLYFKMPEAEDADPQPENIPLDIVYEDDDLIVINKQAGLVVHPGAGNWTGTLVNALLYHCGDSLSGIGGVKRPGIVHRLDKDTSGLMLVAKNDQAHAHLSAQLADRSLSRIYTALVWNVPLPLVGKIDMAIGRDHKNRLKQAVKRGENNGRDAVTYYKTLQTYGDGAMALVECKLETGRTHQIRVHMQAKGYPLIGDPIYGAQPTLQISRLGRIDDIDNNLFLQFPRQALHAKSISFIHPNTDETMTFDAQYPTDFKQLIEILEEKA